MAQLLSSYGYDRRCLTLIGLSFTLGMLSPSSSQAYTTQGSGYFCYQSETQALQNARSIAKANAEQRCAQQRLHVQQLQWRSKQRLPQHCEIVQVATFQCAPQKN